MTIIGEGQAVVTSGGTAVPLGSANTKCDYVMVSADSANTTTVYAGTASVSSSTPTGTPIPAGVTVGFPVGDLDDVYVSSETTDDFVTYTYFQY